MNNVASPNNSDHAIEAALQAAGDVYPRVTLADIVRSVKSEYFILPTEAVGLTRGESPLDTLTICVLVLQNGFTVIGESACADPRNFNLDIGCRLARENAVRKIWPLMGYALKDRLHREATCLAAEVPSLDVA